MDKNVKQRGTPDKKKNIQIHVYQDCLDLIPYHSPVNMMIKNIQSTPTSIKQPTPITILLFADDSISLR